MGIWNFTVNIDSVSGNVMSSKLATFHRRFVHSIALGYCPHAIGIGQRPGADGLLDFEGIHMPVAERVVKAVAMCFVEQKSFAIAPTAQHAWTRGSF